MSPQLNNEIRIPSETIEEKKIDESILKLLGDEPVNNDSGPPIHDVLSVRWSEVLKSGLNKEIKEGLKNTRFQTIASF